MQNPPPLPVKTRFFHLQLVLAIAHDGSIHRAAEQLNLSQPAVTRALSELERQLGVTLFTRSRKGMELNDYGRQFARHAQIMLNQLQSAVQNLAEIHSGVYGRVNVAMLPAATPEVIPRTIQKLDAMESRITVSLTGGSSRQLVPMLLEGELDMIVGRKHPDTSGLHWIPLFYDPISIVCGPLNPLAAARCVRLEDLIDHKWIFPASAESLVMIEARDTFSRQGLELPRDAIEIYSMQAIRKILRLTDRIAVMSYAVANDEKRHGLLSFVPVDFDAKLTPIGIATRPPTEISPAVRVVIDIIEEVCLELKDEQPVYFGDRTTNP